MPDRGSKEEQPSDVEVDIIRSFGWSLVEDEETLFQRFQSISVTRSLVSRANFRSMLRDMEAMGFISPIQMHDRKGYKKLVAEINMGRSIHPEVPLDEIRLVRGSMKAKPVIEKSRPPRVNKELLELCESIGTEIQIVLEDWMFQENGRISKGLVHKHMKNMCDALYESEDALFEYVHEHTPGILVDVGHILQTHGSDFLMLTLRLTESNIKKYSF
ncbi:MAG: hypothetical protein RTU63_06610 [Candidatus Thorarchaeota archaeon]